MIIAPFLALKSANEYRRLWTKNGAPVLTHGLELKNLVQQTLGNSYVVEIGMHYQDPSTKQALATLKKTTSKKLPFFHCICNMHLQPQGQQ